MKKTSIIVLISSLLAMFFMNLLSNNLSFVTYLVIVISPILIGAIYIVKGKNDGIIYNFHCSLLDTIIYTLVYGVGSYIFYRRGGYKTIVENSLDLGSQNIAIGIVEGLGIGDFLLPFFVTLIIFYLSGRKSQRNEVK